MNTNNLQHIQETEKEALAIITKANVEAQNLVASAENAGQARLEKIKDEASTELSEIIAQTKKEAQNAKLKYERQLTTQLQRLNNIDSKTIEKAADLVIKSIAK